MNPFTAFAALVSLAGLASALPTTQSSPGENLETRSRTSGISLIVPDNSVMSSVAVPSPFLPGDIYSIAITEEDLIGHENGKQWAFNWDIYEDSQRTTKIWAVYCERYFKPSAPDWSPRNYLLDYPNHQIIHWTDVGPRAGYMQGISMDKWDNGTQPYGVMCYHAECVHPNGCDGLRKPQWGARIY
ncbi:hypothetical protein IAU60_001047 [Kwoniella sp. DSM 27419]